MRLTAIHLNVWFYKLEKNVCLSGDKSGKHLYHAMITL